jgi:origin recognition complex subunit 1
MWILGALTLLGLSRITFPGYTHPQLQTIIQSRLSNVPHTVVHPDAIQFAARKVAAVSGDARRALDICRRAVELAEIAGTAPQAPSAPNTPSKTGRGKKAGAQESPAVAKKDTTATVTIATIKAAIAEATASPLANHLRALPLASKLFLAALLARVRRAGIAEVGLGDVVDEAGRLARGGGVSMEVERLGKGFAVLDAGQMNGDVEVTKRGRKSLAPSPSETTAGNAGAFALSMSTAAAKGARILGMGNAVSELTQSGIVNVETRRGERVGRVRLAVGDEEVRSALKDDELVKGMGFAMD